MDHVSTCHAQKLREGQARTGIAGQSESTKAHWHPKIPDPCFRKRLGRPSTPNLSCHSSNIRFSGEHSDCEIEQTRSSQSGGAAGGCASKHGNYADLSIITGYSAGGARQDPSRRQAGCTILLGGLRRQDTIGNRSSATQGGEHMLSEAERRACLGACFVSGCTCHS